MVGWLGFSSLLLFGIGCLHVYWALGGKWGMNVALPTAVSSKQRAFVPGKMATLLVSVLLFGTSLLLLVQGAGLASTHPYPIVRWGCRICVLVFGLRVIGDFKYIGLFKKVRDSRFAKFDSYLFVPLCLWLCLSFYAALRMGG
ncbi:hypothetical protein BC351_35560 [Paenibacillus ferrarius]|uniref:DUF3995 domain-containing protein n=1 Tax=Paenibacillus ferrarius TaxID=1469647 RepID=A0A1V4HCY6_9BACL|nr:DUF3995 domain-containing protein [Paenibacillus ferrarius]OPH51170.1 hypothetical protein BC351_35560 [Paenibacillus ferrarius]